MFICHYHGCGLDVVLVQLSPRDPTPPPRLFDILTLPGEDLAASALMCAKAVAAPRPQLKKEAIRALGREFGTLAVAASLPLPPGPSPRQVQSGSLQKLLVSKAIMGCAWSLMPASHRARKGAGMGGALLRSLHLAPQEAKRVVWQDTFFLGYRSTGRGGGQVLTFLQGLHRVG